MIRFNKLFVGSVLFASIAAVVACGPQSGEAPSLAESLPADVKPPCDGAELHQRIAYTQCSADMKTQQVEQDNWCCPDKTMPTTTTVVGTTDVACGSAIAQQAGATACTYRHVSSICAGCGIGCTQPFFEDCVAHSCAPKINMITDSKTGDCVVVCVVPATGEQP